MKCAADIVRVVAPILFGCSVACGGAGAKMDAAGGAGGGLGGVGGSGGGLGGSAGTTLSDAGLSDAVPTVTAGQFTIIYGGTMTRTLTTCVNCYGLYHSDVNYGTGWLEMANSGGAGYSTTVSVSVTPGFSADWSVGISFLENNPTLPLVYQGNYYFTGALTQMQVTPQGCITLDAIDLELGGGMAASFDCTFEGGASTNQQPAEMRGSFTVAFTSN